MEAYTDGKRTLFRERRRQTALPADAPPADAPPAYAKSQLGDKTLAWCAANLKGFAWPRVVRKEQQP
jgi:hypothetical protein